MADEQGRPEGTTESPSQWRQAELPKHSASRQAFGFFVGAACLVWVFHDVDWGTLSARVGAIRWIWVVPASACEVFSYVCEGLRWHYLFLPVGILPVMRAAQAIYIGLLGNQVLPMRLGELVRAYVVGRWMNQPIPSVLPSVLLGRLLDGVAVVIAAGIVALAVVVPAEVARAARLFGFLMLILVVLLALLVMSKPSSITQWARANTAGGVRGRLRYWAGTIAVGLCEIRSPRLLACAALATFPLLLLQALAFWLAASAYGLPLTFFDSTVVFLIVHLGTAIPSAPANVGPFQFFTVMGLGLFGVDKSVAAGFSVFVFAVVTIPLSFAGLISVARSDITLAAIGAELRFLSGRPPRR